MHCVGDLETLGVGPKAVIASIGAVAMDKERGIYSEFYVPVSIHDCVKQGMIMDTSTVQWWIGQASKDQRAAGVFKENALPLLEALTQFSKWWREAQCKKFWGNGADFDIVIMRSAYAAIDADPPFGPYSSRCYRTIKSEFPEIKMERVGVHHNALDDAKHQALHLLEYMKKHNFG